MLSFLLAATLVGGIAAAPLSQAAVAPAIGEAVETTSGPVSGHEAPWPANSGVSEYLGIPYAEPPLGQLRFGAPQTYTPRGPINGSDFAPGCYQAFKLPDAGTLGKVTGGIDPQVLAYVQGMGGNFSTRSYSEDCLALNIWSKPGSTGKAVLVWIYGGAFLSGDSAGLYYNGARMAAEQDVIVASINYRIGVFGFPGSPDLPDQNVGLLDQRKGIEWLRDNIEKFGGDPKRMTLFGESAGGASVDYYSYAWTKDPIVNGFIAQSGAAGLLSAPLTGNWSNWFNFATSAGCPGRENGAASLACVRKLSADKILEHPGLFLPFADGKTVFSDYAKRGAEGNFIKRPLLVGNLDAEMSLFPALIFAISKSLGDAFGLLPSLFIRTGLVLIDTLRSIPSLGAGFDLLACGSKPAALARFNNGVPVWRYRMFGDWPNLHFYYNTKSYHSMDVPLVFGATERASKIKDTDAEKGMINQVMSAWAAFAKDPDAGLETQMGWPRYNPNNDTLILLGYNNDPIPSFTDPKPYDRSCW